jgi:hypothetical protein
MLVLSSSIEENGRSFGKKKLYGKCLLNIPCTVSVDFTRHLINNLEKCGVSMSPAQ